MPCSGPRGPDTLRSLSRAPANGKSIWIGFDDGAKLGSTPINRVVTREVHFGEGTRGESTGLHAALQFCDGGFVELEPWYLGRLAPRQSGGAEGRKRRGHSSHGTGLQETRCDNLLDRMIPGTLARWLCIEDDYQ
jgi:hypothetical protein